MTDDTKPIAGTTYADLLTALREHDERIAELQRENKALREHIQQILDAWWSAKGISPSGISLGVAIDHARALLAGEEMARCMACGAVLRGDGISAHTERTGHIDFLRA